MATLNDWGKDVDESLGDVLYEDLENKVKDGTKDLTKKGAKAAGKGADVLTDKIKPIKNVKDNVKHLWHNNPIAKVKNAAADAINTAKSAVKNTAKKGIKGVGKAAVHGLKSAAGFLATHPVIAVIGAVVLIIIVSYLDSNSENSSENIYQSDDGLVDNPSYVNVDGMTSDDIVVVLMDDCTTNEATSISNDTIITSEKEEKAARIYSVFHSFTEDKGFNNASMAGILANLDCESGLDPTAIEGIFSEYGILGTKKAQAFLSIDNYTQNTLFPIYDRKGTSYNRNGYKTVDGHGQEVYYCGIGLAQWTADNAKTLFTAANTTSVNWYDMSFQLAFMASDALYRPGFFSSWVDNQYEGLTDDDFDDWFSSYTGGMSDEEIQEAWEAAVWESWVQAAKDSALKFVHEYEGNTKKDEERMAAAETWYTTICEWGDSNVDSSFKDSVASFASNLGSIGEWNETADRYYRCTNNTIFDNSSLATAGVSYAWATKDQSRNNGTPLYQTIHDTIMPGDTLYKSCDRSVGLAVRWSGTDDEYPLSGTGQSQLPYLLASSKWELVGMASSLTMDDLEPGDVFILSGHTFMYVGAETIESAYAGAAKPGSNSISGSLGERSPGCGTDAQDIINRNGVDWTPSRGVYYVFRCSNPDHSTKYSNIGAGVQTN